MEASHHSFSRDYDVSLPEVDTLVKISQETAAVYGARMTGGGFGGSIVLITEKGKAQIASDQILALSLKETGLSARVLDIC
jgi:galactokinase